MSTVAVTPAAQAGTTQSNMRQLLSRITRDQGPEYEQTLPWLALSQQSTPTSLRTDRKIKFFVIHFRGRITNAGTGPTLRTGPSILGANNSNVIFSLIQQVTIRGQHVKYGSQTLVQMRGEAIAEYLALTLPNYIPQYTVTPQTGGAPIRFGALDVTAAHTNDIDFVLPIPLFPPDVSPSDSVLYAIHGPDWPGNIYMDVLCADGTALATANPPVTFTAFGVGTGNPSMDILSIRPLVGKDNMASLRPALTFRITYSGQPTATVNSISGTGIKLSDLTVGKDTARIFLKAGVQGTNESAGVVCFGSLSDGIVTRTFFSTDNRPLRFQNANADSTLQDYMALAYGRFIPIGYKMIDFISGPGTGAAQPKAAFGSSQMTAARKFELDGDVTAAANQIAEVTQEMILGRPALLSTAAAGS